MERGEIPTRTNASSAAFQMDGIRGRNDLIRSRVFGDEKRWQKGMMVIGTG